MLQPSGNDVQTNGSHGSLAALDPGARQPGDRKPDARMAAMLCPTANHSTILYTPYINFDL